MKKIGLCAISLTVFIVIYMTIILLHTFITEGLIFKRYSFHFLGTSGTSDILVVLGGIGYGWLRQKQNPKFLWLGFAYLMMGAFGIFLTEDRGGAVAFFILMIILLISDPKRLIVLLAFVSILIVLAFKVEALQNVRYLFEYLVSKQSFEGLKTGHQLDTFKTAWLMIQDHWLMGVGTNNFSKFSEQYNLGNWYAYAHNIVLQFWAENGLFGMLFGMSIIGITIYRWSKSIRRYRYRYLVFGFGASFIGLTIGQMTNSTIWIIAIAIVYWLMAGVINAIYFEVKNEKKSKSIDEAV
jgi:O-antigen ligase